jgi:hypothetical protein
MFGFGLHMFGFGLHMFGFGLCLQFLSSTVWPLRTRGERPADRRTAEERDELAPSGSGQGIVTAQTSTV